MMTSVAKLVVGFFFILRSVVSFVPSDQHLVVLCHGITGAAYDLNILSNELESRGCIVLKSQSNEFVKSLYGLESGSSRLAKEIKDFVSKSEYRKLTHIRFDTMIISRSTSREINRTQPHLWISFDLASWAILWEGCTQGVS